MTSPDPSTSSGFHEPPLNSLKMARNGLAITFDSTLRRPRCAMPITISFTPSWPPRLMICSSAGMIASPPSSPNRFVPVYLMSAKRSNISASMSLRRMAVLPFSVKRMSFSAPSILCWIHDFCAGEVMCMNW